MTEVHEVYKVRFSDGNFEGPSFHMKAPEHKARIFTTIAGAKQSAAVKHRGGEILRYRLIRVLD